MTLIVYLKEKYIHMHVIICSSSFEEQKTNHSTLDSYIYKDLNHLKYLNRGPNESDDSTAGLRQDEAHA